MTYFRFKILKNSGKVTSGVIQLPYDNVLSAMSHLERNGDTVILVKKINRFIASLLSFFVYGIQGNTVKRIELAEFFNNVSVMLKAGIPLLVALKDAGAGINKGRFGAVLDAIVIDIEAGAMLSETLLKHPKVFSGTIVHLLSIGEETGNLDTMMLNCSQHLKRIDEIIRNTKQALLYPAIVITLISGGMLFWFYYVVPKILTLFIEMDAELPALTKGILRLSNFIQNNILTILIVLFLGTALLYIGVRNSLLIKKLFQRILISLPVFKTIIIASNLAFITEYFSLLLNAGIDVVRSIKILNNAVGNEVYRDKMQLIGERIANGETVAEAFTIKGLFPHFVLRMIKIGEQSGSLPAQLEYIADDYRTRLNTTVDTIGKMIEPVVLIIAGGAFAIILAGLFLPIYDLVSQVGNQ
ncbi:MAG: type II secretion system F family protein [candidate division Zixibacteria bacterium]|nr:type II secretion system F family protein [candidate division Zixibacteria bacterium]